MDSNERPLTDRSFDTDPWQYSRASGQIGATALHTHSPRHPPAADWEALAREREILARERETIAKEHETLAREYATLSKLRLSLFNERDALQQVPVPVPVPSLQPPPPGNASKAEGSANLDTAPTKLVPVTATHTKPSAAAPSVCFSYQVPCLTVRMKITVRCKCHPAVFAPTLDTYICHGASCVVISSDYIRCG